MMDETGVLEEEKKLDLTLDIKASDPIHVNNMIKFEIQDSPQLEEAKEVIFEAKKEEEEDEIA